MILIKEKKNLNLNLWYKIYNLCDRIEHYSWVIE